jgi:hypothetical protein
VEYEQEFVTSDMSLSAFARSKGVPKSAMARKAREKDAHGMTWYDKKEAYALRISDKAFALTADTDAAQLAIRQQRVLKVGDMVLDLFEKQKPAIESQIEQGKMPISVRDMVAVAELMRVVLGGGHKDSGEKPGFNLNQLFVGGGNGTVPPELLGRLESVLRSEPTNGRTEDGPAQSDSQVASAD